MDRRSIIRKIAQDADLAQILEKNGIQVRRSFGTVTARCPFHDDQHPSLHLYPSSKSSYPQYHCFACQAHGNAFELVQKLHKCDFNEALKWLANETNNRLPVAAEGVRLRPIDLRLSGLHRAFDVYTQQTPQEEENLVAWIGDRKLPQSVARIAEVFFVTGNKLSRTLADDDFEAQAELLAAGLITRPGLTPRPADPGYLPIVEPPNDHFRKNRILFTMRNSSGQLAGFAGRSIGEDSPKYLYSRGFPRTSILYRADAFLRFVQTLRNSPADAEPDVMLHLFIVEGPMDALRLESLGLHAVAILGSHLTDTQREELKKLAEAVDQTKRLLAVHLFLDADIAGQNGTQYALPHLLELAHTTGFMKVDIIVPGTDTPNADPDTLFMTDTSAQIETVTARLQQWSHSPLRFMLSNALKCHPASVEEAWLDAMPTEQARSMRHIERLIPRDKWPTLVARTSPFSTWMGKTDSDASTEWGKLLQAFLQGSITVSTPALLPPTIEQTQEQQQHNLNRLAHATLLAYASKQRREFPIDEGSWERLQSAADIFRDHHFNRLATGSGISEPMIAVYLRRKSGEKPRLKALPCPEDLILQQYVLNELLRDVVTPQNAALDAFDAQFADLIPAIRFSRNETRRTWTTGPRDLRPVNDEAVSFAYQIDMDVVNGYLPPRGDGMFRPYHQCWVDFIEFIDHRVAQCDAERFYAVRLDLHRFYDNLPRYAVLQILRPALMQAFNVLGSNYAETRAPLFNPHLKQAGERANSLADWLCDHSFHYKFYDPGNGEATPSPDALRGIPQGPDLSAYLANIALFPIDRIMSEEIAKLDAEANKGNTSTRKVGGVYARYVDDIVLVTSSPVELQRLEAIIEDELRKIGLELSKKTEPIPPMRGEELRCWLTDQRGRGVQVSGPFAAPPSEIPLVYLSPLADIGEIDRKGALACLHDSQQDDPEVTPAQLREAIRIALTASSYLRHGDFVVAAKRLWRIIAQESEGDTSPLTIASAMHEAWKSIYEANDEAPPVGEALAQQYETAYPVLCWLEGLERFLHVRVDRNPMYSQQERERIGKWRLLLAKSVAEGLCQALVSIDRDRTQSVVAACQHMVDMRIAVIRWAALQILPAHQVPLEQEIPRWFTDSNGGAVTRYHLSIAESLATLHQQPAGFERATVQEGFLLIHEAIARLSAYNGEEIDPLQPMVSRLQNLHQSDPLDNILILWRPEVTSSSSLMQCFNGDLSVCRTAFHWFCIQCAGNHLLHLLDSRPYLKAWACQAAATDKLLPLPIPPGLAPQALVMYRYASPDGVLPDSIRALFVPERTDAAEFASSGFLPKLQWNTISNETETQRTVIDAGWNLGYVVNGQGKPKPPLASPALLGWLATSFTGLAAIQQQLWHDSKGDGKFYEVVPTAYTIMLPSEDASSWEKTSSAQGLVGFLVPRPHLGAQAFLRHGHRNLRMVGIPSPYAHLWRIGVALADLLGRPKTKDNAMSLRLSAPSTLSDDADWASEGMLRYSLAILQGNCFEGYERDTDTINQNMPIGVKRVLRHLDQFAQSGTDESERLSLLLDTLADSKAANTRSNYSGDMGLPGAGVSLLAEMMKRNFTVDEELSLRLPDADDGIRRPKRRTAFLWATIGSRLRQQCGDGDFPALTACVAGTHIAAVESHIRGQVLDIWASLTIDMRRQLREASPALDEWELGEQLQFYLRQRRVSSQNIAASISDELGYLLNLFVDVTEDKTLSAWGRLDLITPLGWVVLLGILTGLLPSNFRGRGIPRIANEDTGNHIRAVLKNTAKQLALPAGAYKWDDPWADISNITTAWSTTDMNSVWEGLMLLDEALGFHVEKLTSHIFTMLTPSGKPCELRTETGTRTFETWHVRVGHVHDERPSHYEHVHDVLLERDIYTWSETYADNRLLGVDVAMDGLAALAGVNIIRVEVPAPTESLDGPLSDGTGGDDGPTDDISPSGDQTGEDREQSTAVLTLEPTVEPHPATGRYIKTQHERQPVPTNANLSTTQDEMSKRTGSETSAIEDFRRLQEQSWHARKRPNQKQIRIALMQFNVDDSYRHPVFEVCKKSSAYKEKIANPASGGNVPAEFSWANDEYLPSCAEFRRQQLLREALRACRYFDVDILLLPEYSTRPETVDWLKQNLPELAPHTTVWAGTHRLPPGHDALNPIDGERVGLPEWCAALQIVANDYQSQGQVRVFRRVKKYPSVNADEWFQPTVTRYSPAVTVPSDGRFEPLNYTCELICSEIFLATSPANALSMAAALRDLRYQFNSPIDKLKERDIVVEDFHSFSCYTSHASGREYSPRRTVVLVPAMTHRAQDYALFGQASFLAASLTTIFCNAAKSPYASGRSCFIGTDSWDHPRSDVTGTENIGPYHGVFPGIYDQSLPDKGWLGGDEQAMVIADVDPIYAAEGQPRPQVLPPTLRLVAHLPIIESTGPMKGWTAKDVDKCFCCRMPKYLESRDIKDDDCQHPCAGRSKDGQFPISLFTDFRLAINQAKSPSAAGQPAKEIITSLLERLATWTNDGTWLKKRANAFKTHRGAIPARSWPPPTAVDWLYIDLTDIGQINSDDYPKLQVPPYIEIAGQILRGKDDDVRDGREEER